MSLLRSDPVWVLVPGSALLAATFSPAAVQDAITTVAGSVPGLSRLAARLVDNDNYRLKIALAAALGWNIWGWLDRRLTEAAYNGGRIGPAKGWDDWTREIAVVTGGSGGFGKKIVEKLAAKGLQVAILDVQAPPESLSEKPGVHFYQCDVSDPAAVAAVAEAIRQDIGHPSILVNNAGICRFKPILETQDEFLQKQFGVNTMAMWFTTKQFLPWMIQANKGHIVTVTSISSFVGIPLLADYSATKAAARIFHDTLTTELKLVYEAPNVLTTVAHPNFAGTPLIKAYQPGLLSAGSKILDSNMVTDKIVGRILSKKGGELIVPEWQGFMSRFRGWPAWLQVKFRERHGRKNMAGYKARKEVE